MSNPNDSAFPVLGATPHPGMTLRQWYAGLALNGLLSNSAVMTDVCRLAIMRGTEDKITFSLCDSAVTYADALLAALEPQP